LLIALDCAILNLMPNLADPEFEPKDEDLQRLSREAFARVREDKARVLHDLRETIAALRRDALSKSKDAL